MTDHLDAVEAEWLRKLTAMREAISKLNLLKYDLPEITLLSPSDDEFLFDSSGGNATDFLSDESDDEEDDLHLSELPAAGGMANISYDREWLEARIKSLTLTDSDRQADDLLDQTIAVLASDSTGQIFWSRRWTKQLLKCHR
jgi:hypothetical protein